MINSKKVLIAGLSLMVIGIPLQLIWMFLGGGLVIIVGVVIRDEEDETKREEKLKKEEREWWARQEHISKYAVKFIVKEGLQQTTLSKPWISKNHYANWFYSSKDMANERLQDSYKAGYFTNNKGETFPACGVWKAWVEEAK